MIIREVKESDNDVLFQLIRAVFEEHNAPKTGTVYSDPTTAKLYQLFRKEKSCLWVAEEEGEILGCGGIYPTDGLPHGCVELVKVYLSPKARGKGLGKKLIDMSLSYALELGYNSMYIESLSHFSKAIGIYENMGFRLLDEPMAYSGHPSCKIWMFKELTH